MSQEAADRWMGQVIGGRYRIEAKLGEGGAGAVYRAEHLGRGERVAFKVQHADLAAYPEMEKRFTREVHVASRLDHPNVVTVHDSGQLEDGSRYYVMELLEGTTLDTVMKDGRLALPRALAITRQLLDALGHAHARGVAHRDVKPENVMLVKRAGVETVKLVDFGIAGDEEATEQLTATGMAFGTLEYLSPEMAMGQKTDGRADLYAVGVILFEMLTGQHPFVGLERGLLVQAHAFTPPPSPRAVAPEAEIPPGVEEVILRAMVKSPDERFATAGEMKDALIQGMAAGAAEARRPTGEQPAAGEGGEKGGWIKKVLRWPWGSSQG